MWMDFHPQLVEPLDMEGLLYYTFLCKGLEHPPMLVSTGILGPNPMDTEELLYASFRSDSPLSCKAERVEAVARDRGIWRGTVPKENSFPYMS